MSIFPNGLDTDLEIPRVDNEVSEISGDVINAIRDAIFNIEDALGASIQGSKPSLKDRLSVSIDTNGNLKASAIEAVGLVTLPINNTHVGTNAAISEGKLDLTYSTQSLKNSINSLTTDVTALQSSFGSVGASLSGHVNGLNNFHDGYQIKINSGTFIGVAGLSATTIGDAVNEISTIFITGDGTRPPHIDLSLPVSVKHTAAYISVDSTSFTTIGSSSTVQDALDNIDTGIVGQQTSHMDDFHANGILKEINSGEFYNPNQLKVGPVTVSYTVGTTVAQVSGVSSFSDLGVVPGDILEIASGVDDAGTYRIQAVGPRTGTETLGGLPELAADEVDVFYVFTSTEAAATGSVYKAASISSESAPLACSIRNSETLVDTVSILNPNAARAVSIGFNGDILNADGYQINIEVGLGNGHVRGLTIPNLHYDRLGSAPPSVVDAQSVAERINAYVSHPTYGYHFPITAFRVGNELAIAHNMVGEDYTLKILDGYTGNRALGLDAYGADILDLTILGNTGNLFNINGVSRSTLRTLVDGYATITSDSSTFAIFNDDGSSVNPVNLGIGSGSVLHITGHPRLDVNGSYTLSSANTTTVSVFSAEQIPVVGASTTFNVLITDSNVSLHNLFSAETDLGIVEIFVDENGRALVNQRLTYDNSIGSISIVGVSNGFPSETITLNQASVAGTDLRTFNIVANSVAGQTVTLDKDFLGTFKVYHSDNINYLTVRVNSEITGSASSSVVTEDSLNLDEALKLCSLHFDGSDSITALTDNRSFGNIGENQIRDDFIDLFSRRPVDDLRADGVVRGFDLMNIPYVDSLTNMQALPLNGGTAYINGVRVVVETQKVLVQSYDSNGAIVSNVERIIGINDFGTLRAFSDDLGEILSDGYTASVNYGRILPLYKITLDGDGLISDVVDLRRFINSLDDKIDIVIDESNNVVGSFRSLHGALVYAESYPNSEKLTVRIINTVQPDRAIVVPSGVSIIGGAHYGGDKHKIVNTLDLNDNFITLSGNNRLENVEIVSETIDIDGSLVYINGSNVNVEKCFIRFTDPVALGSFTNGSDYAVSLGSGATENVSVVNNKIDKVFSGVVSATGCDNLVVNNNTITNVVGFGAETHGIFVGNSGKTVTDVEICGNRIEVPSIVLSDIMGVKIAVTNTFDNVRIHQNIIRHDGGDTMTSGIHVENITAGSDKVGKLNITENNINGVQLDDNNIFGIYVNDTSIANVSGNILSNIGSTSGSETAFIKIDSDVSLSNVHNNILSSGNVLSGIDVGTSTNASIVGNIIDGVGDTTTGSAATSTVFIRGNSVGAVVSDNKLIGSSTETSPYGIYWAGAGVNTQISGNTLQANSAGLVSFRDYGIRVLGTDMDISNNTIVDLVRTGGTIAISSGSGGSRTKIIGNTIRGTYLTYGIEVLGGSNHTVSGNTIRSVAAWGGSAFIRINSITNSTVMGNNFIGLCAYGITDDASTISGITIANNTSKDTAISIDLGSNATGCFVIGNSLSDSDVSRMGPTPSTSTINRNLIGANQGLLDSVGISFAEGVSSVRTTDGYAHWAVPYYGDYVAALLTDTSSRIIRFPINKVPNGARLVSLNVTGWRSSSSPDTLTVQAFKKSIQDTDLSASSISSTLTISSTGFFADTDETLTFTTTGNVNVVNYEESTYYITIISSGGSNKSTIHGLRLNFRY